MLISHALTSCPEFNTSLNDSMTQKCLFITSGAFLIFLMNIGVANECVPPESISTCKRTLEIDSSLDITERFTSVSALVSVNTQAFAFSCCVPFSR